MKRLGWSVVCAVLVLGVSLLFAYGLLFAGSHEGRHVVTVPNYVGLRERELQDVGRVPEGITLEIEYVFDESSEEGMVLSQLPYPASRRKIKDGESCTVKLTVSLGARSEVLPDLRGMEQNRAKAILQSYGLRVLIEEVDRVDLPDGRVITSQPRAGEAVTAGRQVKLTVSRHKIHGSVQVGDYVGMHIEDARTQAALDGLVLCEIEEVDIALPQGYVVKQSLENGAFVAYQTEIKLAVSSGREASLPFFGGITESEAVESETEAKS